jgi:hypothetical protein
LVCPGGMKCRLSEGGFYIFSRMIFAGLDLSGLIKHYKCTINLWYLSHSICNYCISCSFQTLNTFDVIDRNKHRSIPMERERGVSYRRRLGCFKSSPESATCMWVTLNILIKSLHTLWGPKQIAKQNSSFKSQRTSTGEGTKI